MMQLDPQHPKQKVAFYISDDIEDENDVVAMREVVTELALMDDDGLSGVPIVPYR